MYCGFGDLIFDALLSYFKLRLGFGCLDFAVMLKCLLAMVDYCLLIVLEFDCGICASFDC